MYQQVPGRLSWVHCSDGYMAPGIYPCISPLCMLAGSSLLQQGKLLVTWGNTSRSYTGSGVVAGTSVRGCLGSGLTCA